MKKSLSFIVVLILAITCCAIFTGCDNNNAAAKTPAEYMEKWQLNNSISFAYETIATKSVISLSDNIVMQTQKTAFAEITTYYEIKDDKVTIYKKGLNPETMTLNELQILNPLLNSAQGIKGIFDSFVKTAYPTTIDFSKFKKVKDKFVGEQTSIYAGWECTIVNDEMALNTTVFSIIYNMNCDSIKIPNDYGYSNNSKPEESDTPTTPEEPDEPDTPTTPEEPDEPDTPTTPEEPDEPDTPTTPEEPEVPSVIHPSEFLKEWRQKTAKTYSIVLETQQVIELRLNNNIVAFKSIYDGEIFYEFKGANVTVYTPTETPKTMPVSELADDIKTANDFFNKTAIMTEEDFDFSQFSQVGDKFIGNNGTSYEGCTCTTSKNEMHISDQYVMITYHSGCDKIILPQ